MIRALVVPGLVVAVTVAAACTDLPLSTATQEAVTLNPPTWDLGSAAVGAEVGPRSITIAPSLGQQADTIVAIATCPEFRVDTRGQSLPVEVVRTCDDQACSRAEIRDQVFDVFFRPSFAGEQTCLVTFDLAEPTADLRLAVSGTGVGAPIDIAISEPTTPTLDFGDILVGAASASRTVTVRNVGVDVVLSLTIADAVVSGAGFAVSGGPFPLAIPIAAATSLAVTCTPGAAGPATGTLTVTSDDPDAPSIDVPLACNGVMSPLAVNPSPAVLPATRPGEPSSMTLTVVNNGAATATLGTIVIEAGAGLSIVTAPATGTMVLPTAAELVEIGFAPVVGGDVEGAIAISFDDGSGPQTRRARVIGQGRASILSVTPSGPVDLGPTCAGTTRAASIVATNTGAAGFTLENIMLAGPDFALVPVSPGMYPVAMPPRGEGRATFEVSVTPTAAVRSAILAIVTLTTDIPGQLTRVLNVTTDAIPSGVTVIDEDVDTGAARVGDGAGPRTISLANCEPTSLGVTAHTLAGPDAADFVITSAPPFDVIPGETATWQVELRPLTPGRKTATLRTTTARGELTTNLTGEGFDPTGVTLPGDDRGSYYACASGRDPGVAVLIALALGAVLRGRRRRRPLG